MLGAEFSNWQYFGWAFVFEAYFLYTMLYEKESGRECKKKGPGRVHIYDM